MRGKITLHNQDCVEAMKGMGENEFDLALVDPPYLEELGNPKGYYGGNKEISDTGIKRKKFKEFKDWKIPEERYFRELFRVSENQIIWGCNYFAKYIPHVSRIIWDKRNDSSSFSKCEIASKSMNIGVDIFRFMWNGMLQQNMKEKEIRIHPTQKPVQLYKWLLQNYAKPGDTILDTHLGSGSSLIAAYDMGFSFTGCEIDRDYFNSCIKRFNNHKAQQQLFGFDFDINIC